MVLWHDIKPGMRRRLFSPDSRLVSTAYTESPTGTQFGCTHVATGTARVAFRFPHQFHIAFRASWVDGGRAFLVNRAEAVTHVVLCPVLGLPRDRPLTSRAIRTGVWTAQCMRPQSTNPNSVDKPYSVKTDSADRGRSIVPTSSVLTAARPFGPSSHAPSARAPSAPRWRAFRRCQTPSAGRSAPPPAGRPRADG